jgi:hypothetical protein
MRLVPLLAILCCAHCGGEIVGGDDDTTGAPLSGDGRRYTLWIHGYSPLMRTRPGDYGAFGGYFGSSSTAAGVNKLAVQWNGQDAIGSTNLYVRNALDCFCTGPNWCYVAAHSAGDAQIGYALSHYGGTPREVKDASAVRSDGSCAADGSGRTQTGWNISWVVSAGGAGGGSELAPLGQWLAGAQPLEGLRHAVLADLNPPTTRTLYDHDQTRGLTFHMFAGAAGGLWSSLLPGQDDQVVAYHSAGAARSAAALCNEGDSFCDGNLADAPKWRQHELTFQDTDERYTHHPLFAWSGIVGVARQYVLTHAYQ